MNTVRERAAPSGSANGQGAPDRGAARGGLPEASLVYLEKSLKKQWKRYRKELKRCQDNFSEKAIHDSRVQTRRLLSTIGLLGGFVPAGCVEKIESALKEHLDGFDDLRDTQVQLPVVRKLARTFAAARPFLDYLEKREGRFRKETCKRIKNVKIGRLGELMAACREEFRAKRNKFGLEKSGVLLLRSMDRAYARAAQLRARIDPRHTKTIHRTRVAFKKFRYMAEALADFLPGANDRALAAMHHYQTMMGGIQDAEVLLATWDKFCKKEEAAPEPARRLREELTRRRQWLIRVYLHAAGQLSQFWPLTDNPGAPATVRAVRRHAAAIKLQKSRL